MYDVSVERQKYIGGSDIPAVMGISPFKKRFDLLLEKAELKDDDFKGNEYTRYGQALEPQIRDYINEISGTNAFEPNKKIVDDMRYHSDGFNGSEVLEIKTTSQIHDDISGYKVYLVQLLYGMVLNEVESGMLAVYDRPEDFNTEFDPKRLTMYAIDLNDYSGMVEEIFTAVDNFRKDLERVRENPLITEPELINLDNEIISELVDVEQNIKILEEKQKELKAKIQQAMTDHSVKGLTGDNGVKIALVAPTADTVVQEFDEKTFKTENSDLYNKYMIEKKKKGRAAYIKITMPKAQ